MTCAISAKIFFAAAKKLSFVKSPLKRHSIALMGAAIITRMRSSGMIGRQSGASNGKRMIMAYLEITLQITPEDRRAAAGVYRKYKEPFLSQIAGPQSLR
ncbi:hypothetical protein GHK62_26180 [Sinorhizobium terangae]|uniref:Uncharacterized protein n=1 Tax=Sinorhizobium terangae TaxID=110322 RepID=A0A6N7LN40_SINTE|nr:hypothetical protein [Sinorhizobium terangae]MQX18104.1 hypothetical protein [Sinorhizobium terangae]